MKSRSQSVKEWREKLKKKNLEKLKNGTLYKKKNSRRKNETNRSRSKNIREWKNGENSYICEVDGCQNIPGQDGFPVQWDHILDRERFPELIDDPKNTRITCGSHNDLDYEDGIKIPLARRMEKIKIYFGVAVYDWAKRKIRDKKRTSTQKT